MNEKYFGDCTNPKDLGTRYSEIVRVFGLDTMPDNLFKKEVETEFKAKMDYFTSEPKKSAPDHPQASETIVSAWLKGRGVPAERIGKWYWVPKDSVKGQLDEMKAMGFRFSQSKQCWYWRAEEHRSSNPNPLPIEEIRRKYGSNQIKIGY